MLLTDRGGDRERGRAVGSRGSRATLTAFFFSFFFFFLPPTRYTFSGQMFVMFPTAYYCSGNTRREAHIEMAVKSKERRGRAGMFCTVGDQMSVVVVAPRAPRQKRNNGRLKKWGIVLKNINSSSSTNQKQHSII